MRRLADDYFFAARAMRHETEQIGLCPGHAIQRRLKTQQGGGVHLQGIDGRIFAIDVIADFGVAHGLAHLRGGAGDGVAAEIDEVGHV